MLLTKPLLHAVFVISIVLVKNCTADSDSSNDDSESHVSILTDSLKSPCRNKDYRRLLWRGALVFEKFRNALMSSFNGDELLMFEARQKLESLGFPNILCHALFEVGDFKSALVVLENAANSPDCIEDCQNSLSYSSESSDESSESSGSHYSRSKSHSSRSYSSDSHSRSYESRSCSRSHRRYEPSSNDIHVSCPSCNSCPSMSCESCSHQRYIRTRGTCKHPTRFHLKFNTNNDDSSSDDESSLFESSLFQSSDDTV